MKETVIHIKDIFNSRAVKLILAIGVVLILAILAISLTLSSQHEAEEQSEERSKADKFDAVADAMSYVAAPTGVKSGASTVSLSLATSYVPQPADMMSFRFDARRLIFAKAGDTLKLKTITVPPDLDLGGSKIIYNTSNDKVATVAKDGTVTATGWGKCTITAQIGDEKATCAVAVARKWAAITFDDGPGQ
jgi:hypothetical protein